MVEHEPQACDRRPRFGRPLLGRPRSEERERERGQRVGRRRGSERDGQSDRDQDAAQGRPDDRHHLADRGGHRLRADEALRTHDPRQQCTLGGVAEAVCDTDQRDGGEIDGERSGAGQDQADEHQLGHHFAAGTGDADDPAIEAVGE